MNASLKTCKSAPEFPALGCPRRGPARAQEVTIPSQASVAYAEDFPPVDEVLKAATQRADEVGCPSIAPAAGAVLQLLAVTTQATAVVEIGTGAGVSGLWLLRGMAPQGVLTSVDSEPEHTRLARTAFAADEIAPQRFRLITGTALEVLPRLTDGGYDLVYADAAAREADGYLAEAIRLLRPRGVFVLGRAFASDRLPDPAQRDADTVAVRTVVNQVRDDERFVTSLLPVGDGLLVASRRS